MNHVLPELWKKCASNSVLLKVRVSLTPIKLENNEWNKIVLFNPLCYTVMFDALTFSFFHRGQTKQFCSTRSFLA